MMMMTITRCNHSAVVFAAVSLLIESLTASFTEQSRVDRPLLWHADRVGAWTDRTTSTLHGLHREDDGNIEVSLDVGISKLDTSEHCNLRQNDNVTTTSRGPCHCPSTFLLRLHRVRLSVRQSVCQTRGLWQDRRKFCPDFLHHIKDHLS